MSTEEDTLWDRETRFWTGGRDYAERVMGEDAVMVFPYPAGILQGRAILDGMDTAPRWRSVEMSDRVFTRKGPLRLLAYRASAERADTPIYTALCASTWMLDGEDWRLVAHQQTPIEP